MNFQSLKFNKSAFNASKTCDFFKCLDKSRLSI